MNRLINDEILSGLLLGDAYLAKPRTMTENSHLEFEQSQKHEQFVLLIQNYLQDLGIESKLYKYLHKSKNKKYCDNWGVRLYTPYNTIWTELRKVWYHKNKKIVPNNIKLTPKTLAYWFMCDGGSFIGKNRNVPQVYFYTQSFSIDEIINLKNQIESLGIMQVNIDKIWRKEQFKIRMGTTISVNKFMSLIEPYIIPIFRYKIKYSNVKPKIKYKRKIGVIKKHG